MTLWRWILPVAAGVGAGWLMALGPEAPAVPVSAQNARPSVAVASLRQGNAPVISSNDAPRNKAAAIADRELASAEDLIARIVTAGPEELRRLYGEVTVSPDTVAKLLARTALYQRWVETDPAGGLKWLLAEDSGSERQLLATWLRMDQPAATAWAQAHPAVNPWVDVKFSASAEELRDIMQAALANPQAFSAPNGSRFPLDMLAQLDPAAAQALFASVAADDPRRARMASVVGDGMASADPVAALAWLRSQNLTAGYEDALARVLMRGAWKHPDAVLHELESCGLPAQQMGEVRDVIAASLAQNGPAALQAYLSALRDNSIARGSYSGVTGMKAGNLSLVDMHALMQQMQRTGARVESGSVWDWTGRDPARELTAISALPDDESRARLVESLRQAAVLSGSLPKPEDVASLPESVRSKLALDFASVARVTGDESLALKWLDLAPAAVIAERLRKPVEDYSSPAHEEAQLLYERLPPGERSSCTAGVAAQIARNAPDKALAWAATLPPGDQPAAWEGIADGMARANESAVAAWVQSLPDDATRDGAVRSLSIRLVESDPDAALTWSLTIRDEEMRRLNLNNVVANWAQSDPESARHAVADLPLTETERAAVNSALEGNKIR